MENAIELQKPNQIDTHQEFKDIMKNNLLPLALATACSAMTPGLSQAQQPESTKGIIYAEPQDISSNVPLEKVLAVSAFFQNPQNMVKIQFPTDESKFAWVNMSKYYHSAQVMREGPVSALPYGIDPAIGKVVYKNRDGKMLTVNEHFDTKPIDAMIVVKSGKVVYERYKTMRPDDKHIWYSVSKVTGSTMLAFLEHEGKVDVNKPVSDYLPELKGSEWDTVKVVEALDMATGLNGTEHDEPEQNSRTDPDQIWYRWAATEAVGIVADVRKRNESWVDVLRAMKRKTPGHEKFEYNSINTFVVNRIAERVAGKPLYEQFSERIWSEVGMEHDAYYLVSPSGNTLGFMGVNSTLRDLARFGMVFTPSCKQIAGEQIIPDAIMKKIHDRTYVAMYDKGYVGKNNTQSFYDDAGKIANRYQWDAVLSDGDLFKAGVGGQGVYISPATDTVVAWFCTGTGKDQEEAMARAIVKSLK
jgi:CubicO group peptidase (beta-lactamase class C family)